MRVVGEGDVDMHKAPAFRASVQPTDCPTYRLCMAYHRSTGAPQEIDPELKRVQELLQEVREGMHLQ